MSTVELEPHEQLDEIRRHTNDDGTVSVRILNWKKRESTNMAVVRYLTPGGKTQDERMPWPESHDETYKFVRFIEASPTTMRAAEKINDDEDFWLDADPSTWDLHLPEDTGFRDRIPRPQHNTLREIIKFVVYPFALMGMATNLLDEDMTFHNGTYKGTVIEDEVHHARHLAALKSAIYTAVWFIGVAFLIALI